MRIFSVIACMAKQSRWIAASLALLAMTAAPAFAFTVDTPLPDAAQEQRARALFGDIRCVVCEAESIADSPAEVAVDMRAAVRGHVASGKSDGEIKAALVTQYGERILMRPQFSHVLLWLGPLLLLLGGGLLAWRTVFRRRP